MNLISRYDHKPAVIFGTCTRSYIELQDRIARKMELLQKAELTSRRIALDLPDSCTFLEWVIACWGVGHCVMILDQRLTEKEKQLRLQEYRPSVIIRSSNGTNACPAFHDEVHYNIIPCSYPDELYAMNEDFDHTHDHYALVLFTSGSTGLPKQIVRSMNSLQAEWTSYGQEEGAPDDEANVLCLVPVSHTFGLVSAAVHTLISGGTVLFPEAIKAKEIVHTLTMQRITHVYGVAFHYQLLLPELERRMEHISRMPLMVSSGGPLQRQLIDQYADKLQVRLGQQYGMSEVGYIAVDFQGRTPYSVGKISPHIYWNLGDERQIRIHLPCSPYPKRQENWIPEYPFASEGVLLTQDIVDLDDHGYLYLVSRTNDVVSIGGLKVKISEVEHMLKLHANIQDCCVIAVQHPIYGCALEAYIVWEAERAIAFDLLRDWLKNHLADYKIPRKFHAVAHIPTSASGKILKGELLKEYSI